MSYKKLYSHEFKKNTFTNNKQVTNICTPNFHYVQMRMDFKKYMVKSVDNE